MIEISETAAQTKEIARRISREYINKRHNLDKSPTVFCLVGDLGAGKTVFAKGFAEGLGVDSDITSPTFSILNEYNGIVPFYHFDVYRIKDISEMYYTGYEDYFYDGGVCLIEWANLIEPLIPKDAIWITISVKGENLRHIEIS